MIDATLEAISFSQASPYDQTSILINPGQLQAFISQAVAVAIQPLQDRIESLETTIASQNQEISALKENWKEARPLTTATRLDDLWAWVEEIDSRTTSQPAEPTTKTQDHIDQLARVMTEDKRRSVSIATAAKLLCISKERMRQLKPLLLADSRFELGWDRQRGQRKRVVIRLKQFIK